MTPKFAPLRTELLEIAAQLPTASAPDHATLTPQLIVDTDPAANTNGELLAAENLTDLKGSSKVRLPFTGQWVIDGLRQTSGDPTLMTKASARGKTLQRTLDAGLAVRYLIVYRTVNYHSFDWDYDNGHARNGDVQLAIYVVDLKDGQVRVRFDVHNHVADLAPGAGQATVDYRAALKQLMAPLTSDLQTKLAAATDGKVNLQEHHSWLD